MKNQRGFQLTKEHHALEMLAADVKRALFDLGASTETIKQISQDFHDCLQHTRRHCLEAYAKKETP